MFLYGRNSIFERLKANPKSIRQVFLQTDFKAPVIEKLTKVNNIALRRVSRRELLRIKHADSLGGVVAQVDEFKYAHFVDLANRAAEKKLSFVFLDRIFDPQNLGAIIRTTACFGGFAVIIPKHKACEVTEAVLHVASGGENYTPVVMVSNLTNALIEIKKAGCWIAGAVTEGGENVAHIDLPFPLSFVLGSEGSGMRYGLQKHIDIKMSIPMEGASLSFNVSAACAVLCYEITRQRAL